MKISHLLPILAFAVIASSGAVYGHFLAQDDIWERTHHAPSLELKLPEAFE